MNRVWKVQLGINYKKYYISLFRYIFHSIVTIILKHFVESKGKFQFLLKKIRRDVNIISSLSSGVAGYIEILIMILGVHSMLINYNHNDNQRNLLLKSQFLYTDLCVTNDINL